MKRNIVASTATGVVSALGVLGFETFFEFAGTGPGRQSAGVPQSGVYGFVFRGRNVRIATQARQLSRLGALEVSFVYLVGIVVLIEEKRDGHAARSKKQGDEKQEGESKF
jgi:hypothetical protein